MVRASLTKKEEKEKKMKREEKTICRNSYLSQKIFFSFALNFQMPEDWNCCFKSHRGFVK